MTWNFFLLIVSVMLLVFFAGVGFFEHVMQAEAVAEDVTRHIDVDQDVLRTLLQKSLQRGVAFRVTLDCAPLIILSILLAIRLITEAHQHSTSSVINAEAVSDEAGKQ